ncbi:MAG: hypothetical protein V7K47_00110 [Nostoc sp.]
MGRSDFSRHLEKGTRCGEWGAGGRVWGVGERLTQLDLDINIDNFFFTLSHTLPSIPFFSPTLNIDEGLKTSGEKSDGEIRRWGE